MTLANNATLTRFVEDIPQFIQAAIVPLCAHIANLGKKVATLEVRGDYEGVAFVRVYLSSYRQRFTLGSPPSVLMRQRLFLY